MRSAILIAVMLVCAACSSAPSPQTGWSRREWDAGHGSWAFGGFGVAYTVDLPQGYTLDTKLGKAWIGTDDDDDAISLEFWTDAMATPVTVVERDGRRYSYTSEPTLSLDKMRKTVDELAARHPKEVFPVILSAETSMTINGMKFRRIDFSREEPQDKEHRDGAKQTSRGFWLRNDNIIILVANQSPTQLEVCNQIVATLRRK